MAASNPGGQEQTRKLGFPLLAAMAHHVVFQSVGNLFSSGNPSLTGNITFTIIRVGVTGAAQIINTANSGNPSGSITANDIYVTGAAPGIDTGDILTLAWGTPTTTNSAVPRATGSFNTFVTNPFGTIVSTNGATAAAPEPGSLALLLPAGVPVVGIVRRRKKASASA